MQQSARSGSICSFLMSYIVNENPEIRKAALEAIISQNRYLSSEEQAFTMWHIAPLVLDLSGRVRSVFERYKENVPFSIDYAIKTLSPHNNDAEEMDLL